MKVRRSMNDIQRAPSIAEEAAEWLATVTDDSCTDEERQTFVEWLKRSNLHVDEFLRVSALTQRLTKSDAWPQHDIEDLIAEATAVRDVISALPRSGQPDRSERHMLQPPRWAWMSAACALVLALVAVLLKYEPVSLTGQTYATSIGELRSLTLEDGSVVELNTNSKLRTHFSAKEREVQLLRGEAVFKVAKNPHRPFRVSTGHTQIVAVGTEFNVYARAAKTVVTVLEGRVRVSEAAGTANHNLELAVNEQAVIAPHLPIARVKLTDSRQVTSWTERRLIFEETRLFEAADEFARYNTRIIHIETPALRDLRVSGVFNATDPASLVQFVEAYGNVSVKEDAEGWTLDAP
jgi:transmembrane sensor